MWKSEFVFFVKKDNVEPNFEGYKTVVAHEVSMRHGRIGIIRGNSYHKSFWEAFPYRDGSTTFQGEGGGDDNLNERLIPDATLENNIENLVKGRVNLFPCDKIMGMYISKMMGLQKHITYYEAELFSKGYPMPFVKKSSFPNIKKIADQYEQELIKLKKSKKYSEFMDKWIK